MESLSQLNKLAETQPMTTKSKIHVRDELKFCKQMKYIKMWVKKDSMAWTEFQRLNSYFIYLFIWVRVFVTFTSISHTIKKKKTQPVRST